MVLTIMVLTPLSALHAETVATASKKMAYLS